MRGIAALLVYVYHLSYSTHDVDTAWAYDGKQGFLRLPLICFFNDGHFMVAIFFVLSEYALSYKPARLPFHRERHAGRYGTLGKQMWAWATAFFAFANPFTARDMPIDPHLWTISIEYGASIVLYVTQLGLCRLRTRYRLLSLLCLVFMAHQADRWPNILFFGGFILAELDHRRRALATPSISNSPFSSSRRLDVFWFITYILIFICGLYLGGQPELAVDKAPGWMTLHSLIPKHIRAKHRYWVNWAAILLIWSTSNSSLIQKIFTNRVSQYLVMARTKAQALKESSAPPWYTRILVRTLEDHGSSPVKIAWSRTNGDSSPLPPFPFHVYVIRGADSLTADEVFAERLMYHLQLQQLCDPCWHLEIFTTIRDNVFACIDHYEQEKTFRKFESQAPYMPDKNCFLVVDSDKWEDEGLLSVQYIKENAHLPYNMHAERFKSWDHLVTHLREEWSNQGMTTIEELLDGQNIARGWPIDLNLYPGSGPDESVNGKPIAAYEPASPTSHHSAHGVLDFEDINVDVNGVVIEQREDLEGFPYTALRSDSSQAPHFVFCLFVLARDTSSEDSLKVFARLNTGLLADISWALHLYSDATMSSAFSIFTQDMNSRRHLDTSSYIPSSYARSPLQIYQDVYMCLDASKPQPDGPSFILSNPGPDHASSSKRNSDPDDLQHIPSNLDKYAGERDGLDMFTFNPGSRELVADMLHTYYAISSHTKSIAGSLPSPTITPISLRISVNAKYSSDSAISLPIELFITSHASEPLTLNVNGTIFDTADWHHYVRIVHAGSSIELTRDLAADRPPRLWSLGRSLLDHGFTKRVPDTDDERPPHLATLYPDVSLRLPVQRPLPADILDELRPDEDQNDRRLLEDHEAEGESHLNPSMNSWRSLYERYRGSWEVGKKYTVELQHGTTISRWTWGTANNPKGPYGLPALQIEVGNGGNQEFMLVD
ncbi:hypothetical protein KCU95_g11105, partial [Aureobasidium melanogenum]